MRKLLQVVAIVLLMIILRFLYSRYIPIYHVKEMDITEVVNKKDIVILDIRDFNVSYKDPIEGAVNVPLSYLNRNFNKVKKNSVFVVSSDIVGKNLAVRLLKRNEYEVIGYTIRNDMRDSSSFFLRQRNNKEGVTS